MKNNSLLLFIIFLLPSSQLFSINQESLKKYPYQLLTNDYGILNESNLKRYTEDMNVEPFTGKFNDIDYWQCFPTKNVTVWYEKGDYDPDEKITHGSPYIQAKTNSTTIYEYVLRRAFSLEYAQNKVKKWQQLMKNQQFVCIGGSFVKTNEKNQLWVFENLKTKKGCDSYFSGWCS
ncbi:MAG TPA: hypothetical protein VLG50_02970 [Candidatus Saccharimonadales bacterium]|nr:hypothetical protein [Candidatus Saccharimonadales bacterium]